MNFVKAAALWLLLVIFFVILIYTGYLAGVKESAHDTADEFFRYCYDHGGILTNNETGEKIGCMAVTVQRGDPA